MKTFGEIALTWPKSNAKKKLIQTRVISKTGISSKIFRETGIHTDLNNDILGFLARTLSINGYRIDEKPFREKMLPKLVVAVENENEKAIRPFWTIYDKSCVHYLMTKQPTLNKCLENESPLTLPKTTKEFFQQLALQSSKYNFSREALLEFAEFWHFEELEKFEEEVFSNDYNSLVMMDKLVEKLTDDQIKPLKSDLELLKKDHVLISQKIENIPDLNRINILIDQASSHAKDLKSFVDKKFGELPIDIDKRMSGLASAIDDLKKSVSDFKLNKNLVACLAELTKKIDSFELQLQSHQPTTVVTSELVSIIADTEISSTKTMNEAEFLNFMSSSLKGNPNYGWLDNELITLFHCIFSGAEPLILKDSTLFESWLNLQSSLKLSTIYPEVDWINSEVFGKLVYDYKDNDVIEIENFEIGVYEAYALPLISRVQNEFENLKLVFKSGEYTELLPSFQLLKLVPILSLQQIDRFRKNRPTLRANVLNLESLTISAEASWDRKINTKEVVDFVPTVLMYAKTADVEIPPNLLVASSGLASHLNFYFDEKFAISAALEVVILPYLLEKFGRDSCGSFVKTINIILEERLGIA